MVLASGGDTERGLAETRRVIADRPDQSLAHYNLSRILAKEKQFDEALASCRRAVELDPAFTEGQVFCSLVAQQLSRWDVARAHLEAARRNTPFSAPVAQAWAGLASRSGALEQTISATERLARTDRAARFTLIYLYEAAGRKDEARALRSEFE
jgi:tetratricopeptide (TPR) repeat protein